MVYVEPVVTLQGEPVCCRGLPSECGQAEYCFSAGEHPRFDMILTSKWFEEALTDPFADQFVYSARLTAGEQREVIDWQAARAVSAIFEQAASYCYELKVLSLATNEAAVFAEGCIEHSSLTLPDADAEAQSQIEAGLARCSTPPEGFETLWCEIKGSAWVDPCASTDPLSREVCENEQALCPLPGVQGTAGDDTHASADGDVPSDVNTGEGVAEVEAEPGMEPADLDIEPEAQRSKPIVMG